MKAVAGMANPLLEACVVRTGTRLAFRHLRRHGRSHPPPVLFDFDRSAEAGRRPTTALSRLRSRLPGTTAPSVIQERFLAAVQAEEAGEKLRAIALYEEILEIDPEVRAGMHQSWHAPLSSARVYPRRGSLPPRHGGRPRLRTGLL